MNVKVKKDEQGFYIDIADLSDIYDVSKIAYYTIEEKEDTIKLSVYNKQKRLLKPKTKKKKKK